MQSSNTDSEEIEIFPPPSPFRDPVAEDDDLASTADILARFVGNSG